MLTIDTDAHHTSALHDMEHGVRYARRAWLTPENVLNTRSLADLLQWLQHRRGQP
jgi:DNA polymerase (family 10)